MAQVNLLSIPRPAQEERKPSLMEQILQGLQIAKGVYDIRTDEAKLGQYNRDEQAAKAAEAQKAKSAEGYLNPSEKAALGKEYNLTRDPEAAKVPGAIRFKDSEGEFVATPKPKDIKTREIRRTLPSGEEEISIVPDVLTGNKPYISAPKPKEDKLVAVDEYDPETKTMVKKFVNPQLGASYAQAPREDNPNLLWAKQKAFDDRQIHFSEKIQPLAKTYQALGDVEQKLGFKLDDYDPETQKIVTKDANGLVTESDLPDLPGVSVPGFGRAKLTGKARELDAAIQKVFNVELAQRSGTAVTTPELERLRTEYEQGKFNTESEMISALKRYKIATQDAVDNTETPYRSIKNDQGESVVDVIHKNGGFTSSLWKNDLNKSAAPVVSPEEQKRQKALELLKKRGINING